MPHTPTGSPAVESVADKRSGEWVFRDTRMPVAAVFENLEAGSSIEEIIEKFHVTWEQIQAVPEFAARSQATAGSYAEVDIPFK
jgi:uncharacterized protein (DUF433 family)